MKFIPHDYQQFTIDRMVENKKVLDRKSVV